MQLPASHEQSPASRNPRIHPGEAIRNERQRRGMSLRELARRTGVTPSHLSKLERGLTNCSVDTLWMVSEELGIAAADLFAGEKHSEIEVRTPRLRLFARSNPTSLHGSLPRCRPGRSGNDHDGWSGS